MKIFKSIEEDDFAKGVKHIIELTPALMGRDELLVKLSDCPGGLGICNSGSVICRYYGGQIKKGVDRYERDE